MKKAKEEAAERKRIGALPKPKITDDFEEEPPKKKLGIAERFA